MGLKDVVKAVKDTTPAIIAITGMIKAWWAARQTKKQQEATNKELRSERAKRVEAESKLDMCRRNADSADERRSRVLERAKRVRDAGQYVPEDK